MVGGLDASDSCDPMDYSPLGSLPMGFPRQEYCSGLPCSPPGDLPSPGIKPRPLALQAIPFKGKNKDNTHINTQTDTRDPISSFSKFSHESDITV